MPRPRKKNIYILGNPIVKSDRLPRKLLPKLQKEFRHFCFVCFDPTEDLSEENNELIIIDTVKGINKVALFKNLDNFSISPRVTVHDYDLLLNLKLMQKLGKTQKIIIIGIPEKGEFRKILFDTKTILKSILL